MPIVSFGSAFIFSLIFIPLIRQYCLKNGIVTVPREDRWHDKPTPSFGGIGIFLSFVIGLIIVYFISNNWIDVHWGLLTAALFAFLLGLYDDIQSLSPAAKLIGQIGIATFVIVLGYSTEFFYPRIENENIALLLNTLLTYVWIIGITNAINLLDNMDGLAGGISLVAALILSYFFWREGNFEFLIISITLSGSIFGFLFYNFPPASIFMGNSGSTFIGFTLAVLAIARQPQASNVFAILGVPTLIFLLPIIDISLVTFTRLLEGKPVAKGGVDHTSHRLVAFGLSERHALIVLFVIALFSGLSAAILESINYWISLVLVPIIVISLAILAAYLSGLRVEAPSKKLDELNPVSRIIMTLTVRRRLLEIILDFFLIGVLYYLAFLIYYRFSLNNELFTSFIRSLPIIVISTYVSFYIFGVYRSVWHYLVFEDLIRLFKASIGSLSIIAAALLLLNAFPNKIIPVELEPEIIFLYSIFLFIGLGLSRSSFRILRSISGRQRSIVEEKVLLYGVNEQAQLTLSWIQSNINNKYYPVGIIASDPLLKGRLIHGLEVIGSDRDIPKLIGENQITGLIIVIDELSKDRINKLREICIQHECWIRRLKIDFELVE